MLYEKVTHNINTLHFKFVAKLILALKNFLEKQKLLKK